MKAHQIEQWWPDVDTGAKQWLREHQGSADIPEEVRAGIAKAGGPSEEPFLGDEDWQFIRTQSESVD
ncbi:hypothetical protein IWX65_002893 [Arthrobacter sp. CAN_A214]|uniref:hypothetical protein n=1 Tax=Arthrobacter sp. CAN_A214 TaxID=2787720 RepID=UPI0018CBD469